MIWRGRLFHYLADPAVILANFLAKPSIGNIIQSLIMKRAIQTLNFGIKLRIKFLRYLSFTAKLIGSLAAILTVILGGYYIWISMVIHQVDVHCYDFAVYFEGPKNDRFIKVMIREISKLGEPYQIRNHRVYSTGKGSYFEQMGKIIEYQVRPEWTRETPHFETTAEEQIVTAWRMSDFSSNREEKYCRFIEAAISRDGIDVKARRQHPDIWPPDQWPVPPQRK